MIESWIGKVKTDHTTNGFTVIIPFLYLLFHLLLFHFLFIKNQIVGACLCVSLSSINNGFLSDFVF